jgi:hypothetical protein
MEVEQAGVGQFNRIVAEGDTLRVGGYLRHIRLLSGPSPNGYYRKQRQQAALAEKREKRAAQRRGEWRRKQVAEGRSAGMIR